MAAGIARAVVGAFLVAGLSVAVSHVSAAQNTASSILGESTDTETHGLPSGGRLEIDKEASESELSALGHTVTYTVRAENVGPGDYTQSAPALVTDDLTNVLDDATLDESSLSADRPGMLDFADPDITWEGALAADESVVITYLVEYTGEGDQVLSDETCVPEDQTAPGVDPCDRVRIPGALIEPFKSVEPKSGTDVGAGEELTYTVVLEAIGEVAGEVDHIGHTSRVVDDAELVRGPTVSDAALSAPVPDEDGEIHITGTLAAGQIASVTYVVQVKDHGQQGDHVLESFVTVAGEEPPQACMDTDPLCTKNPVEEPEPTPAQTPLGSLPHTGSEMITSTLVGVAMLVAGAVMVAARWRRERFLHKRNDQQSIWL